MRPYNVNPHKVGHGKVNPVSGSSPRIDAKIWIRAFTCIRNGTPALVQGPSIAPHN